MATSIFTRDNRRLVCDNQGPSGATCPCGDCGAPAFAWTVEGLDDGYVDACRYHLRAAALEALGIG